MLIRWHPPASIRLLQLDASDLLRSGRGGYGLGCLTTVACQPSPRVRRPGMLSGGVCWMYRWEAAGEAGSCRSKPVSMAESCHGNCHGSEKVYILLQKTAFVVGMHTLQRRFFVGFLRGAPEKSKFWEDRGRGYQEEGGRGWNDTRVYIPPRPPPQTPPGQRKNERGGVTEGVQGWNG